jgi:hypothetical protein
MGTFGLFTAFSFRHSRVCRKVPPAEPASFNEEWNAALKRLLRNSAVPTALEPSFSFYPPFASGFRVG